MKKRILTLALLFACIATTAMSQIQFGVKAVINSSSESSDAEASDDIGFRLGFNAAVAVQFPIAERFFIETDFGYSQQGYKDRVYTSMDDMILGDIDYKVRSHYLNLPITVGYNIVDGLYGEAGVQFGYQLSRKDQYDGWEGGNLYDYIKIKRFDVGAVVGIGYKFDEGISLSGDTCTDSPTHQSI